MKKCIVSVETVVEIHLDEDKFNDPDFRREFSETISEDWDLMDHASHLGWLQATGCADLEHDDEFVEGYGPRRSMGIEARVLSSETTDVFMTTGDGSWTHKGEL